MNKRPLCVFALLLFAVIWAGLAAKLPFLGGAPPVLPDGCTKQQATVKGTVYEQKTNSYYTTLYLKDVILIQNSNQKTKQYPIDKIKLNIKVKEQQPAVKTGMQVLVLGDLKQIPKADNPGQFDEQSYYYARKIKWYMESESFKLHNSSRSFRDSISSFLKEGLKNSIRRNSPASVQGILCAVLLGDKDEIGQENKLLFQVCGISHILAISGLHLSFLGWGLFRFLQKLRLPLWCAGILAGMIMLGYGLFTGGSASALRAFIMFALGIGGRAAGRTYDLPSALALSAIFLLMDCPMYARDSGFLLSYSSVLGIAAILPLWKKEKEGAVQKTVKSGLAVQAASLPITLHFFYEIPLFGILVNILVLPVVGLLLLSALIGGIGGMIWPFLGKLLLLPGVGILFFCRGIGRLLQYIPASSLILGCPLAWKNYVYYAVIGICCLKGRQWKRRVLPFIAAVLLIMIRPQDNKLTAAFLDVGQGDCTVVRQGDRVYLVDGGSSSVSKVGQYRILPYLKWCGIRKVDGIFVSHMDEDHISGIREILQLSAEKKTSLRVKNLYMNKRSEDKEKWTELERLAERSGCRVTSFWKGTLIRDGKLSIQCLHPEKGEEEESNESSQVLRMDYGELSVLFTGDLEGKGENHVKEGMTKRQDIGILKVAHHGSKNSTAADFLDRINPGFAVISCGKENRYGHPHKELLERLLDAGVQSYATPDTGALIIRSDGRRTWWKAWNPKTKTTH